MYERRLIVFLSICLLVVGTISWLRPVARDDVTTSEEFWSAKTHDGDGAYDIVIAGDSRTLMGVAPSAMGEHLPDTAILNFGYLGAGLTPEFVRAAVRKINPTSSIRTLVLGMTPLSLISGSLTNKHFLQESNKPAIERAGWLHLEPVRRAFEPVHLLEEASPAQLASAPSFRADGWMANDGSAHETIALQAYAGLFAKTTFDAANFGRLLDTLAEARARGVRIVAFRPPSSPAMEELEDRHSGFRQTYVEEQLAGIGVAWLSFPSDTDRQRGFASADGSHLRTAGAEAFSAELARRLAARELPPER